MKKVCVFFAMLFALSCCGCSSNDNQEDVTIELVLTTKQEVEFWDVVKQGALDASEDLGIKIVIETPNDESDIDGQIVCLENAINSGVDAIIISPLDEHKLNNSLQKAYDKNIPVLTINTSVKEYGNIESEIGTNNDIAGSIAGKELSKLVGDSGNVLLVKHGNTALGRIDGFVEELEQNHTDIKIVETIDGQSDKDIAKQKTLDALQKNPNIKGIYASNESVAVGVCEAVEELGRDDISIIGFDSSSSEVEYINKGILDGTLVQNPYLFGYLSVRSAYQFLQGDVIDDIVDTGITYVNSSNLTDEDIEALLYPMGKE